MVKNETESWSYDKSSVNTIFPQLDVRSIKFKCCLAVHTIWGRIAFVCVTIRCPPFLPGQFRKIQRQFPDVFLMQFGYLTGVASANLAATIPDLQWKQSS